MEFWLRIAQNGSGFFFLGGGQDLTGDSVMTGIIKIQEALDRKVGTW